MIAVISHEHACIGFDTALWVKISGHQREREREREREHACRDSLLWIYNIESLPFVLRMILSKVMVLCPCCYIRYPISIT